MSSNKTITANFVGCSVLSVSSSPSTSGQVTVAPNPSNCAGPGYQFLAGTVVTLTAVPEPSLAVGYAFSSWSGAVSGSTNPVTLTMNGSKTVTANFIDCYGLTTAVLPANTGTISRSANNCSGTGYTPGSVVILTGTATSYTTALAGWDGDAGLRLLTNPITISMTANKSVTGHFAPAMNVYTVVYTGTDTGSLSATEFQTETDVTNGMIISLTQGTIYHGYTTAPPDPFPALVWQHASLTSQPAVFIPHETPLIGCPSIYNCTPRGGSQADYSQIFTDVANYDDLCGLIRSGQVQEVWIWSDSGGRLAEDIGVGPANGYNDPWSNDGRHNVSDCTPSDPSGLTTKQYAIMGFSVEVGQANAMESYAHRVEDAYKVLFPCDFDVTTNWSWSDPNYPSGLSVSQPITDYMNSCAGTRGFSVRAHNVAEVAQCGLAHWSPNVELDDETAFNNLEYEGYNLATTGFQFLNGCAVWDPKVVITPTSTIDCTSTAAWQCAGTTSSFQFDKEQFHRWWMQNIPGSTNSVEHCDEATPLGNWWLYMRGDIANPNEESNSGWWCSAGPASPQPALGQVSVGSGVSGAQISLFTLESTGALSPVSSVPKLTTNTDGAFTSAALPVALQGKTLVLCAVGGTFHDVATKHDAALENQSLCAMIPTVRVYEPIDAEITPLTDVAYHQAQYALSHNLAESPRLAAAFYNGQIASKFQLSVNSGSPFGPMPLDIVRVRPVTLEPEHAYAAQQEATTYGLALAGLAQQAIGNGQTLRDWISALAQDASNDGILNGLGAESVQSLASYEQTYVTTNAVTLIPPKK